MTVESTGQPEPERSPPTAQDAAVWPWRRRAERLARSGAGQVGHLAVRVDMWKVRVTSPGRLAGGVNPAGDEDQGDWRFLRRPALMGLVAMVAIVAGASLPSSPFKLEMAGTWFFGEPSGSRATGSLLFLGLVAVYGGLVLLMRVWMGLTNALVRRPGVPVKLLVLILVLWTIPVLVAPPLFSRDVFSYAAQGEMMSRHINPYVYGPYTLGSGPYPNPVDPLWLNAPAPYGPLFLMIDGFLASASFHHELVTVLLLRLLELAGVVLIAWCIPKLAGAYGRDTGPAFTLAVLNPLVLLTLVGGAHNDAIMVGLLVAGVTAAKLERPVLAIVMCTVAAAIKAPAALGLVFVAWSWAPPTASWRERIRPLVTAGIMALGIMAAFSYVSGLGWGWVGNLLTPGTVRSWLAPATGIGMGLAGLVHVLGAHVTTATVLSATRAMGLLSAAAISVYLLWNSSRIGNLRALGWGLLLFVILSPVVQPWYLTWGIILLAPLASGRVRRFIVVLSVMSPFIGLPGGKTLLDELIHANPFSVIGALVVLVGVIVVPIGRWSLPTRWAHPDALEPALGESLEAATTAGD